MIPMNLPPCDRRSRSEVGTISVTPSGLSTNRVLETIIPDLVKESTEGLQGMLPSGRRSESFSMFSTSSETTRPRAMSSTERHIR